MCALHHLSPLEYKAVGIIDFRAASPINIGSGEVGIRRTFLRVPGEGDILVIPSSTWKGAFRSISENIAKSIAENNGFSSDLANIAVKSFIEDMAGISYSVPKDLCEEVLNVFRGGEAKAIKYLTPEFLVGIAKKLGFGDEDIGEIRDRGYEARDNLLNNFTKMFLAAHCPIGKLYGNLALAGKVRFLDTFLRIERGRYELHSRAGIAIERESGVVREGNFFYMETLSSKSGIKLRIIADNLTPAADESKLFALTLEAIKKLDLNIGARKSAGLGRLKLDPNESVWYLLSFKNDEGGLRLANPFKYGEKISLDEFIKWLHG